MGIYIEVPVKSIADLQVVDSRVRVLCNTTYGAQCQALLTTEYQSWRRKVALFLQCVKQDSDSSQDVINAYMQGFRISFREPLCLISQCSLNVFENSTDAVRKRKACGDADVF
jgi:hypothetical protein